MRKRFALGGLTMALAASLLAAPGASAAVEFGSGCTANSPAPGEYTLITLTGAGSLPVAAPSSGVITQVKLTANAPLPFSVPTAIKVMRPVGGNTYRTIVQQSVNLAPSGTTTASVRMPIQAGDRLGLRGEPFSYEGSPISGISLYCSTPGGLGAIAGDVPPGSSAEFIPVAPGSVPVVGVIEPDADGDGYGDETQDKCPQSAALQVTCPVVTVDTFSLVGSSSVRVLVATNNAAPVKVTGTAKLGKADKAKISTKAKTVQPGKLVTFTLKFPQKLKDKLKELAPSQKLKLKIVASATNVAGQVSTDKATAKLKGQG